MPTLQRLKESSACDRVKYLLDVLHTGQFRLNHTVNTEKSVAISHPTILNINRLEEGVWLANDPLITYLLDLLLFLVIGTDIRKEQQILLLLFLLLEWVQKAHVEPPESIRVWKELAGAVKKSISKLERAR